MSFIIFHLESNQIDFRSNRVHTFHMTISTSQVLCSIADTRKPARQDKRKRFHNFGGNWRNQQTVLWRQVLSQNSGGTRGQVHEVRNVSVTGKWTKVKAKECCDRNSTMNSAMILEHWQILSRWRNLVLIIPESFVTYAHYQKTFFHDLYMCVLPHKYIEDSTLSVYTESFLRQVLHITLLVSSVNSPVRCTSFCHWTQTLKPI